VNQEGIGDARSNDGEPSELRPVMSTATVTIKPSRSVDGDQRVEFPAVGWKGYVTLLRIRGEPSTPKMVYLDGTLWLMSPSFPHERLKTRLGEFVTEVMVGLRIPFVPAASTTLRRQAKKASVEGDQTYYVANEERMRGRDRIDLRTDPPPDLAIEAVCTHDADEAIEVYRRIRVPEVWICDEAELVILVLQADGKYSRSTTSMVFPFLSAAEIHGWVSQPQSAGELEWIMALRRWVRQTLRRRVRRQAEKLGGD
jgi:Uma2 family endonuclease